MRSFLVSGIFVAFGMAAAAPIDNNPIELVARNSPPQGVSPTVPNCSINNQYHNQYNACTTQNCQLNNPVPGGIPIGCFLMCHSFACATS
ncbi:uncharacterized protein BX664DRAFT_342047 [Halteromyces radiatus]|uniref:uncharacterized protein n=1 Tax=Halteromyces radiatus TaxID=101107 RepID=UPI002220B5DD|nr:uncharacterized protein BX664DRAFT_342047 [Halteromyces radiatus]KAI8080004.1 hypothetical protein BX664DRAFT_342047 [Halteromyces radiatus]